MSIYKEDKECIYHAYGYGTIMLINSSYLTGCVPIQQDKRDKQLYEVCMLVTGFGEHSHY